MRMLAKLVVVPAALGLILVANGCGKNTCEKAFDNQINFTKKDGSEEEKKALAEFEGEKGQQMVALVCALAEKDPDAKKQMECAANAADYKALKACDGAKGGDAPAEEKKAE